MGARSRREALALAAAAPAAFLARRLRAAEPSPQQLIAGLGFAPTDVGFILFDPQSGQALAEQNADQPFLPASVAKLATAYAAVGILGAGYRFSTRLHRRGAEVFLQGGGDPVLASTDLEALAAWLRPAPLQAASAGGDPARLFYDDSLMIRLPEINPRQPVAAPYNTGLSALDVNFNRIEVDWWREPDGGRAFRALSMADGLSIPADWVAFAPAGLEIPAEMPFIPGGAQGDAWLYSPHLPDRGFAFLPVRSTGLQTALLFRELAKAAGVMLGPPEAGRVPADAVEIGRVDSRPLREVLGGLLRYSSNPSAELIGLAASRRLTGRSMLPRQSAAALTAWLGKRLPRIDWRGFRLENHSGLTSDSRVTPRQMAGLLAEIAATPDLMAALPPVADDGVALAAGESPRGLVGKSGTMDYARGLAGFLPARDGRPLGFAIFVFDRARRAALDAAMDPRVLEPAPAARAWIRRALALDQGLLRGWMASY